MIASTQITDDVTAFLMAGRKTAHVSYLASDRRPLSAPVWFVVDDGSLVFATGKLTAKGIALKRDPRIAVSVDAPVPPYAFALIQGIAEIVADHDYVLRIARECGHRYMGSALGDGFGARNADINEVAVRVLPTRVLFNPDVTA